MDFSLSFWNVICWVIAIMIMVAVGTWAYKKIMKTKAETHKMMKDAHKEDEVEKHDN